MMKAIKFNGFLKKCVDSYPNEVVGCLFTENPYTDVEQWVLIPMKNVHKKPDNNFKIDDKEWREVMKKAKSEHWNYIGSIHTHPYPQDIEFDEGMLQRKLLPSKKDIRSAVTRDLIVTGIIVCNDKAIYDIRFHKPYNTEKVEIELMSFDKTVRGFFPTEDIIIAKSDKSSEDLPSMATPSSPNGGLS